MRMELLLIKLNAEVYFSEGTFSTFTEVLL